jgi:hypothetical protein
VLVLFGLPLLVELVTRAVVRGYLDERAKVNENLYGKMEKNDGE